MKNRIFKRATLSLLTTLLLLPMLLSLPLQALALEQPEQDPQYLQWTVSEDGNTISNGEKTYTYYYREHPNFGLLKTDIVTRYSYANKIRLPISPDNDLTINSPSADSEYIYFRLSGICHIYATEAGTAELDRLLETEQSITYLAELNSNYHIKLDNHFYASVLSDIENTAPSVFNVTLLEKYDGYQLELFESEDSFKMIAGGLYEIDGEWYYVDYVSLGNEYFNANGDFSYRRGEVEAYPLSADICGTIESVKDLTYNRYAHYTYENDYDIEEMPIALFWIYFSFLGYVIPLPFLIVGLILPMIKKLGRPKYWYVMAGFAALWMLLAAALMILLIVA